MLYIGPIDGVDRNRRHSAVSVTREERIAEGLRPSGVRRLPAGAEISGERNIRRSPPPEPASYAEEATPMNLTGVNTNLLVSLNALLREQNVSRAAEAVGLTQSSMSHALAQ